MTTRQYLIPRNGVFQFRMRVPLDVAASFGKTHVQHSLRTKDFAEAGRLRDFWFIKYQAEFDELRASANPDQPPSTYTIALSRLKPLVEDWMQTQLQRVASELEEEPLPIVDPGGIVDRDDNLAELKADLERLRGSAPHLQQDVKQLAGQFLLSDGAPEKSRPPHPFGPLPGTAEVDEASSDFRRLCSIVSAALQEVTRAHLALLEEKPFEPRENPLTEATNSGPTLAEAMDDFRLDRAKRGNTQKVGVDYSMTFRLMTEVIGADRHVWEVTRKECRKVLSLLESIPPNATKRFRGKSFRQAANAVADQPDDRLSKTTINQHLHRMGTLFRWEERESDGKMIRNPAVGLSDGGQRAHSRQVRHPFSIDQLNQIFRTPLYVGCMNDGAGYATPGPSRPKGTRFWIPLIGLFQGMRLNEICQLRAADIECIDEVHCIRIDERTQGQRVKTAASRRIVPVHPQLLALGFSDFVAARSAADGWLFPDLKADSRGYRSDGFQKWFRRFQDKAGTYTPETTYHSFRHNWRDAARNARIPEEITEALGGWSNQKISSNYGSGARSNVLFEEISKIDYPGLDLSHLK